MAYKATHCPTELHLALAWWLRNAEAEAQDCRVFFKQHGLCINLCNWDDPRWPVALKQLKQKLTAEFDVLANHPFGGLLRYLKEYDSCTAHRNPERIAWVKKMLSLSVGDVT